MLEHINRLNAFLDTNKCSEYESQMIIRVEQVLGLSPKCSKGKWQKGKDGSFLYKLSTAKKHQHIGPNPIGEKGTIIRDMHYRSAMTRAKSLVEAMFIYGPDNRMVMHSLDLLSIRLRAAQPHEDATAILMAFESVMSQHDFLDRKRNGVTLDRELRKHQMRLIRAERAAAASQSKGESLTVDEFMARYEKTPEVPSFEASAVSEERHVNISSDIDDDDFDDLDSSLDEVNEEKSLERMAAKNSMQGFSAPTFLDFDEFGM